VVALCLGESGPPSGSMTGWPRRAAWWTADGEGVPRGDIYVDPCVLPVSTGPQYGRSVAEAITRSPRFIRACTPASD